MRRLGVGSTSSADRPLRAQLIVALVVALILIAVPLYLLRRPNGKLSKVATADAAASIAPSASARPVASGAPLGDAGVVNARLRLGPLQKVRCGASSRASSAESHLCDALPYFEEALKKAITDTEDCAPKLKDTGSINYVLTIDFRSKSLHVFPGASGQWHGRQARRASECVRKKIRAPDWGTLSHQFRFYAIAVLATYLSPAAAGTPEGTPSFE
jgi:hypothetical protein